MSSSRQPCRRSRSQLTLFGFHRVAAALISNILFNHVAVYDLSASFIDSDSISTAWDDRESDPYLAGEYKIVLQLIGVLQYGKTAKKLTDRAIDNCEGESRTTWPRAES